MIEDLRALVQDDLLAVQDLILDKLKSPQKLLTDISTYIFQGGGKRLRCLLVLLASKACGYQGKEHIKLAAMVEIFHTATLLHDDVVDNSTMRRGQKTVNAIWDNKASILAGDYLFTKYLELLVEVGHIDIIQLFIGFLPQMSSGEIQQFSNQYDSNITEQAYFETIHAKTALLFGASASMGALVGKSSYPLQKSLYAFGLHLGNAFQLIDDAHDYASDANTIGKNIGDDLACGKMTLPLLHALQHAKPEQQQIIKQSLQTGSIEQLPAVLEILAQTKSIAYTYQLARKEVAYAEQAIGELPESIYKKALVELACYAVERSH